MKVVRTIETFYPYVCGPANQAFQISNRLEQLGIASPVITSYCDVSPGLPGEERIGHVPVTRVPHWFRIMRYAVTPAMAAHLRDCDIVHSHNYRNFQTDCGFFLPAGTANRSY